MTTSAEGTHCTSSFLALHTRNDNNVPAFPQPANSLVYYTHDSAKSMRYPQNYCGLDIATPDRGGEVAILAAPEPCSNHTH